MNGIKSRAQDGYAHVKRSISTCWHPYLMKIERDGINSKEVNSSGINLFFFYLKFNRYVILLRGMHHVEKYLFISAQANLCEVRVFES